jgi:NAD(P)H-nitrite reductase large subunit
MLLDGDRGVVLQRDGRTYAIAPHLPCGLISPQMLRTIADVAERFGAALKCTSAQRIAIIGLREQDVDVAWAALGGERAGHMTGNTVRSVRACPGTQFCKRGRQDSLKMGLEIDRRYYGRALPNKLKIGVSGCGNQCAETCIKDIGLVGGARGWTVLAGGNGGTCPRLAREITDREVDDTTALAIVDNLMNFYEANAQPSERLGDLILRLGLPRVKQAVLPAP